MLIPGFKIRYINYAGYEIVLPNGKVIVIDPCINYKKPEDNFTVDDFTGADYILVSHTHYDHTMDLEYLAKKFNSKVCIGQMSLWAELLHSNLDLDHVYPVSPGEVFEFEDFTLKVFRGKHTFLNSPENNVNTRLNNPHKDFPETHKYADIWGSMEYMDYLITTKENVKIFINGGGPNSFFYNNIFTTMKEEAPNVVLRQSSSKFTPEEFAHVIDRFHPQLVLPLHQDGIERKTDMTVQDYVDRANVEFEKMGSFTRMLNPVRFKWYTVGMSVEEA